MQYRLSLPLATLFVLIAGCTSETHVVGPESVPMPAPVVVKQHRDTGGRVGSSDDPADPCATRLHDMIGPMLEYFAIHGTMPATLDDLRSITDIDIELNFTCPVSHEAYIYKPGGLYSPNGMLCLVLYDATPAHNGFRWGVVSSTRRNGHPEFFVLKLSEKDFQAYQPAPVAPTSAPSN